MKGGLENFLMTEVEKRFDRWDEIVPSLGNYDLLHGYKLTKEWVRSEGRLILQDVMKESEGHPKRQALINKRAKIFIGLCDTLENINDPDLNEEDRYYSLIEWVEVMFDIFLQNLLDWNREKENH